jgi:glycosyltransferase involved in cell wall biosynthesis
MRIAFYAPLKPPHHPVPSGDRAMARLLMTALEHAGHEVELASELRSHRREPDPTELEALHEAAGTETDRLTQVYARGAAPDLWFTYHLYYKAPDLIGPRIAARLGIPYVTVEASHALKRNANAWRDWQRPVEDALRQGALHICLTQRDRAGLAAYLGHDERLVDLPPCIDVAPFADLPQRAPSRQVRLVTMAMMRPGNKLASYYFLAAALALIPNENWRLELIGDGPARAEVEHAFATLDPARITFHGELDAPAIRARLAASDLFVWPGVDEAFGMSYLEASAAGLPVLGTADGGIPAVIIDGETGLLTPAGDVGVFASALRELIRSPNLRERLGQTGRHFVHAERSLDAMAARLGAALAPFAKRPKEQAVP